MKAIDLHTIFERYFPDLCYCSIEWTWCFPSEKGKIAGISSFGQKIIKNVDILE